MVGFEPTTYRTTICYQLRISRPGITKTLVNLICTVIIFVTKSFELASSTVTVPTDQIKAVVVVNIGPSSFNQTTLYT